MRRKSTTDYKHFLEDLAGMYPFSIEEAVLVETIANCLDAKATNIEIRVDQRQGLFEVKDDGNGMTGEEFENYHNFSMTFKEKGRGIGFAGLGAKLSLKISHRVITETCSTKFRGASLWEFKEREPEWEDIQSPFSGKKGTCVKILLKDKNSLLLDPANIKTFILKHYLPLFLFADFYRLAGVYPSGIIFLINGVNLELEPQEVDVDSPLIFLTKGRRKKPFGICKLSLMKEPLDDEFQGIGISCFGKIINTEQKELFKQQPKCPERITGVIEVPELVDCLVTSKTAFRKDGYCGVKYYNFYKIAQHHFIKWLEKIGQRELKIEEEKDHQIAIKLSKLLNEIIAEMPELQTLFGAQQIKDVLSPSAKGEETAAIIKGGTQDISISEQAGGTEQGSTTAPGPFPGDLLVQPGDDRTVRTRPRSIKFGPSIGFVSDEAKEEISWTEGIEKIFINKAHPAFKSAEKNGLIFYHYVLAIGFAIIKELPADQDKMNILNRYFTNWGNL